MEGKKADARADVFGYSIALYEALHGARPFEGRDVRELYAAIGEQRVSPAPKGAQVPAWLRKVVVRGLAARPEDRWPSMDAMLAALSTDRRRAVRLAAIGAGLLAALALAFLSGSRSSQRPPVERPAQKLAAVLDLKGSAGAPDAAWVSTAVGELVAAELHAAGGPQIVPGQDVARMERELRLAAAEELTPEALRRVRDNLRADFVVSGSYVAGAGGDLRLALRLFDAVSGRELMRADQRGRELFELARRVGVQMRASLGIPLLTAREQGAAQASIPSGAEAARAYARALASERRGDYAAARRFAEEAVRLEPQHAQSHLFLARILKTLGYMRKAAAEARRASDLGAALEREEQLSIEMAAREIGAEWDRAIKIGRALVVFFPDRASYALRLGGVETRARRVKECQATFAEIRGRKLPDPDDPNLDLAEAWCADVASDFRRMLELSRRAASESERRSARFLAASARFLEGWALGRMGEMDQALSSYALAQPVFHELGERLWEARTLNGQGIIHNERYELEAARPLLEAALALHREIGNRAGEMMLSNNLANASPPGRARELFRQAMAIAKELDDSAGLALATMNTALLDEREGEIATARKGFEDAHAIAQAAGDRINQALALTHLCEASIHAGDLDAAAAACKESGELWTATGAGVRRAELAIHQSSLLARQGRHAEAIRVAQGAARSARELRNALFEAAAEVTASEALQLAGRLGEAALAAARALALAPPRDPQVRLMAAIQDERVRAASARGAAREASVRKLLRLADEARSERFVLLARDALLAANGALLAARKPQAREQLAALEKEARASGDLLIARDATALLAR
jgi:TolB-like protein